MEQKRERFGSRLGFILVSAGCAIGLGNVWKFPYMCGQYGGAAFILIYLVFLLILGLPIIVCEFSVGRASQKSIATSFNVLEPKGTKWHNARWFGIAGNYLLMMFYTMVAGWMLYYCYLSLTGTFNGAAPEMVKQVYTNMQASPEIMVLWTVIICVLCFGVCAIGMQNGVEKITKVMMLLLLAIMVVLAINSLLLPGAKEGIKFYLVPDFKALAEIGIGNVIFGAMSQAFFTLSIGIGSMAIFGSYLDKNRSLTGEAVSILCLDTFVALVAGFIIIPACFAFGVEPGQGPGLIFITIPNIFAQMTGGQIWGSLFFLFLSFAAISTVTAVFENIISFGVDLWGWSRKKSIIFNLILVTVLSIPCVLGFNLLSGIQPLGAGSNIMDLEDFIVSNNLLPLGSLLYVLFCVKKNGWGWQNFVNEANSGKGIKFPSKIRFYMTYIIPAIIIVIYLKGYYDKFIDKGWGLFVIWGIIALAMLAYVGYIAFGKSKDLRSRIK